jgi:mannose-6-phosphate isomerase-like protein (cupin superfamily)
MEPARLMPLFVPAGVGNVLHGPGGDRSVPKISAAQSGDRFALVEHAVAPGSGPPLHVHEREDEAFWILEGEVTFFVDEKTIVATPGSFVYGPRGVPHCFANRTRNWAKMLLIVTPARNFESFYEIIGTPGKDGGAPSDQAVIDRIMKAAPEFGIRILGSNPLIQGK